MRSAFLLIVLALAPLAALSSQPAGPAKEVPADLADVATTDSLVKALYLSISAGPGEIRDWLRFQSLFQRDARLIATNPNKAGKPNVRIFTVEEFVSKNTVALAHRGFLEREVKRSVKQFGNVAQILSSYEIRNDPKEPIVAAGVNAIQLFYDGRRWWITALTWDTDRPGNRLPAELVPNP